MVLVRTRTRRVNHGALASARRLEELPYLSPCESATVRAPTVGARSQMRRFGNDADNRAWWLLLPRAKRAIQASSSGTTLPQHQRQQPVQGRSLGISPPLGANLRAILERNLFTALSCFRNENAVSADSPTW